MVIMTTSPQSHQPHHSSGDWDFEDDNWEISIQHYVSPPSSLRILTGIAALARPANTLWLPQGRIITSHFGTMASTRLNLYVRNQRVLGTADNHDTYMLERQNDGNAVYCRMTRQEADITEWEASFGPQDALTLSTWYQFRFTWWVNWGRIRFRLERWIDPDWVQEGDDIEDPLNKWLDSTINRVGLGGQWGRGYCDNTYIYAPA